MQISKILMALSGLFLAVAACSAATKIEFSHQLSETQADRLQTLIEQFNSSQTDAQVVLVRRSEGVPPSQINLATNEEYARFISQKASFTRLQDLLRGSKQSIDASHLTPELRNGLIDGKGQLFALPLAFSTPVLYINKTAFRKAGLNPDTPPKTWAETQQVAGKLAESGSRCAFTTSWPAWVMIDNMSAWNGSQVSDEKGRFNFNGLLQIKHVAMMATWYKSRYFSYFGRRDEADRRFANGECAMLTSSSELFANLPNNQEVAVSTLPYHDDIGGAPKNSLADGASLWISAKLKPEEKKGVTQFVNYILGPDVQLKLTLTEGFLPMTTLARDAAGSQLLKENLAALQVAYEQLKGSSTVARKRVSQSEYVRLIVEEELEAVWANKKTAKDALDTAVQRSNTVGKPVVVAKAKAAGKTSKPKK